MGFLSVVRAFLSGQFVSLALTFVFARSLRRFMTQVVCLRPAFTKANGRSYFDLHSLLWNGVGPVKKQISVQRQYRFSLCAYGLASTFYSINDVRSTAVDGGWPPHSAVRHTWHSRQDGDS